MSAELFGTSLLQEVHEEALSSLLSDLRAIHIPRPRSTTGIPELDTVVDDLRYPDSEETPAQAALTHSDVRLDEDFSDHEDQYDHDTSRRRVHIQAIPKPKPVIINITQTNNTSIAATSLLLSYLTVHAILPSSQSETNGTVVHIDCLNNFDTATLYNTTQSLIQKADPNTSTSTTSQLAKSALSHVHIIPCPSTSKLLQTLKDLSSYLLDQTAHDSSTRSLKLLIITGLNHFIWQDRFTTELTRLNQISDYNHNSNTTNQNLSSHEKDPLSLQIFHEVKAIQSRFDCTIVYTTINNHSTSTLSQPHESNDNTFPPGQDIYRASALLTLRAIRSSPPQFAPQMSLVECLRDRGRRMEAVRDVRFWFAVDGGRREAGGRQDERQMGKLGFGMRREEQGNGWVFES